MRIKKITYNPKTNLTRSKLASPYSNNSIKERLRASGAINLKNNLNHEIIDHYSIITPIDKSKKI